MRNGSSLLLSHVLENLGTTIRLKQEVSKVLLYHPPPQNFVRVWRRIDFRGFCLLTPTSGKMKCRIASVCFSKPASQSSLVQSAHFLSHLHILGSHLPSEFGCATHILLCPLTESF